MSFAFQSFGLGEFFKAQQRLSDALVHFFLGLVAAPSCFITLGRQLEILNDGIDRLLDENSNRNSAILRMDNKLEAQQMLRVASHGLLDALTDLEKVLELIRDDVDELRWGTNMVADLRIASLEKHWKAFTEKFSFQSWKLDLLYKSLRRSSISKMLAVRERINKNMEMLLEPYGERTSMDTIETDNDLSETEVFRRPGESDLLLGVSISEVIRRLQDSCQFGTGAKFYWKLKAETTLLIILHWTHKARLGLHELNFVGQAPLDARVNLIKAAWVLKACNAGPGSEGFFTEEVRAMLTMLACDVLYMFRSIWDRESQRRGSASDPQRSPPITDYSIFIDDSKPLPNPFPFPDNQMHQSIFPPRQSSSCPPPDPGYVQRNGNSRALSPSGGTFLHDEDEIIEGPNRLSGLESLRISKRKITSHLSSSEHDLSIGTNASSTYSLPIEQLSTLSESPEPPTIPPKRRSPPEQSSLQPPPIPPKYLRDLNATYTSPRNDSQPSFHSSPPPTRSRPEAYSAGSGSGTGTASSSGSPPSRSYHAMSAPSSSADVSDVYNGRNKEVLSPASIPMSPSYSTGSFGATSIGAEGVVIPAVPRPAYSWNERIDRQALGVRPGEVEIAPRIIPQMILKASYTGEMHGRWDDCRVRIFKDITETKLRILTVQVGSEESIDQQIVDISTAELVPEYGYHEAHPVIYIRKFRPEVNALANVQPLYQSTSLYYKFRDASDMFEFQSAFLGECVETDCSAVRTIRYKKSLLDGEHNHYRGRIQIWNQEENDTFVISPSSSSVTPPALSRVRSKSDVKVLSSRIVMYWEETITTLFITDSIEIDTKSKSRVLRIKPSSHKAFHNPTSVKAKTLGTRDLNGGFSLAKKGLFIDDEDSFEEFKWFEIDFVNEEDKEVFAQEFQTALKERRRQRRHAEELGRLAERGVRREGRR
ncbi:hypothetical protein BJ508DRAFT_308424 [Ascobolus immersus RN42]|uniref:Uncharacterized protein n=1 Tax=Ascobolus immersus RN42 TaxID=1160509 RepID=A0A3N4I5F0_ASCIM|nr:hypothetical protein BJ508DRAFT_308424 [Ascobolus immersus RN42]